MSFHLSPPVQIATLTCAQGGAVLLLSGPHRPHGKTSVCTCAGSGLREAAPTHMHTHVLVPTEMAGTPAHTCMSHDNEHACVDIPTCVCTEPCTRTRMQSPSGPDVHPACGLPSRGLHNATSRHPPVGRPGLRGCLRPCGASVCDRTSHSPLATVVAGSLTTAAPSSPGSSPEEPSLHPRLQQRERPGSGGGAGR